MPGSVKRWTGTRWEENPTKVGSLFTPPPRPWKYWSGTAWKQAGEAVTIVAPAFKGTSQVVYGSRTNLSLPKPAVAQNDIMLMCIFGAGVFGTHPALPALPVGWTWIFGTDAQPSDGSFRGSVNVAYKIATASEPASYDMTHATYSSSAIIHSYSGVNTASPFDGTPVLTNVNSAADTNRVLNEMTTTQANSMLVEFGYDWADNTTAEGTPTGMTKILDFVLLSSFQQVISSAGPTGTRTNFCNSVAANPRGGFLITLKGV